MYDFNIGGEKYTPASKPFLQSVEMSPKMEKPLSQSGVKLGNAVDLKDVFKPQNVETINNPDGSVTTVTTYAGGFKHTQTVKTEVDANGQEHKITTVKYGDGETTQLQIDEVKGKSSTESYYDPNGKLTQTTRYTYEPNSEGVSTQKTKDTIKYDSENPDENGKPTILWEEHDYGGGKSVEVHYGDGSGRPGETSWAVVSTKEGNHAVELSYDMENTDVERGNVKLDENGQIITKDGSKPRLSQKVVDPGLPTQKTSVYDYDDDGTCTVRTYDAAGQVVSIDILDADGNSIIKNTLENLDGALKDAKLRENTYTVQKGESYRGVIIRNLQEQGIQNPTDAEIKEAMADFEMRNPGAVKTSKKGVKYLLAGAQVTLPRGETEIKSLKTLDELKNAKKEDVEVVDTTEYEKGYKSYVASAKQYTVNGATIIVCKDANGEILNIKVRNANDSDYIVDAVFWRDHVVLDADGNYSDGERVVRKQQFDLKSMLPEWILSNV